MFRIVRKQSAQIAVVDVGIADEILRTLLLVILPQRDAQRRQRVRLLSTVMRRSLAGQRLQKRFHVLELLERRPSRVSLLPPMIAGAEDDGEGLGEVFEWMTLRVIQTE